ncbi:hypothetical protein [Anaerococcus provencensis]|uniref:hypothetical protein n=1 Tax=Anaerococcus provencensis TaxID=938293 RepID=UPI0002DD8FA5|nr:hypothetical protein [Anaerococcus provencensis]
MKRSKTKPALFILIGLIIVVLISYFIKGNNKPSSVIIENDTSQSLEAVGIFDDSQILICKDENNNYLIPNNLFANGGTFRIVAKKDSKTYTSREIKIKENDKIKIINIKGDELILENQTSGEKKALDLPDIKDWNMSKNSDNIKADFSSDTSYNYTLYVLGKDGELGTSDTLNNGKEVSASWEAGENMTSLVKFDLR